MDLEAIAKLVEMMRRTGVQYIKTPEVELYLGPEPLQQPKPGPVNITADDEPEAPKQGKGRLSSLYDHPALRWPGGTRPQLGE